MSLKITTTHNHSKTMKTIQLGANFFADKSGIISYLSKCLLCPRTKINTKISVDKELFYVLRELVYHHPKKDKLIGDGIEYFTVGEPIDYPGRCFYLRRRDGSITDFSTKKAINNFLKSYSVRCL